jgi:V8-like Glu-specific endopeptidase
VFFTKKTSGGADAGDWVCSGTSVNSPGLSLVWTAGHCVHGGPGYAAHENWTFIPAYSSGFNGDKPYGTWHAKELWTKAAWAFDGNVSYDVGAAVVWKSAGLKLTQKIGGQGIWFNISQFQNFSAFGYPAALPFNGYTQHRCDSPVLFTDDPGPGPDTSAIFCNMTGGSSGGGWLINMNADGWGLVNSVNSYKYQSSPNFMYGPYHGAAALNLYDFVKNKTG